MATTDITQLPRYAERCALLEFSKVQDALDAAAEAEKEAPTAVIADIDDRRSAEIEAALATLPENVRTAHDDWSTEWDGHDERAVCCAISGLPILADDETVCDDVTGEVFLRAAIGLPPREEGSDKDQ